MLRTLLVLLLLATPTAADVGPFPYATGASLYVLFNDGSDTAVTLTEGATLKAGTYTAADAAIVTAGLGAGTHAGRVMIGSAASPSASDPVVGVVERFVFDGTNEVDQLGDILTDTAAIPSASAIADAVLDETAGDHVGDPNSVGYAIAAAAANATTTVSRLTAARAGYLDNLSAGAVGTSADIAAIDALIDAIKAVTDLLPNGGALTDIAADAASAAASSASNPNLLQSTTIATLTSQTVGTLTAGSADDDAYNNCLAVITDASTTTQKAVVVIADYIGSTKQFRLAEAPDFTIAATDSIAILAQKLNRKTNDTVSDRYTWRFPRSGSATASNNQVKLPASSANIRTVAFDLDDVLEDGVTVDVASAAVSGSGATVIDTTIGEADRTVLIRLVDTSTAASYTVTLTFTASDSDSYTVTGTLVLE